MNKPVTKTPDGVPIEAEPKSKRATIVGRNRLEWRGDTLRHAGRAVARLVVDETWPGMWRVRTPDGRISDMVNLSRARDAAETIAIALEVQETARAARPCAETARGRHG